MVETLDFKDALREASRIGGKKQLLLGNGFSIECHSDFRYGTLFEQALKNGLPEHLQKLFGRYGNNFEEVLKYLDEAAFLCKLYGLTKGGKSKLDMQKDYATLKEVLVKTISDLHPDHAAKIADEKYKRCLAFLKRFEAIFTVNYDLLLYWTALHIERELREEFPFADGFGRSADPQHADCSFSYSSMESKPYIFFLHGALHLYAQEGSVWKRVWNTRGVQLIRQVREAFEKKEYPLVVTEGKSEDKMVKIEASSYLYQAFRKFKNIQGHLFVFGHSLGEQDGHLIDAIIATERLKLHNLWVGLYGAPHSGHNQGIVKKAYGMQRRREKIWAWYRKKVGGPLGIRFFRSESAEVWG